MTGPFIGSLILRLLSFLFSRSSEIKILFYFSPHFCISLNLLNKKLNNLKIRLLIYIICNRLLVLKLALPYDSPPLFSAAIVHHFSFNGISLSTPSPTPFATYFMYLYHFISIDLESSRSCNSSHCKSLQPALPCPSVAAALRAYSYVLSSLDVRTPWEPLLPSLAYPN